MTRSYLFFCANLKCPSRKLATASNPNGGLFRVDADELVDGEEWLCPNCRAKSAASA